MYRNFKVATKSRNYQSPAGDGSYIDCIGIFILFMRVTGWHGLFPSWEGLGVGSLGREISVNPVRKFGRGFKPLPHCIFSKLRPFGRRLLSNGVNISRITDLPTPKSPPKRGLSNLILNNYHLSSKPHETSHYWEIFSANLLS